MVLTTPLELGNNTAAHWHNCSQDFQSSQACAAVSNVFILIFGEMENCSLRHAPETVPNGIIINIGERGDSSLRHAPETVPNRFVLIFGEMDKCSLRQILRLFQICLY